MQWTNPLTAHPQRQGISYIEHWCFAMGIAFRLLRSVVAFILHAMLPCIPISPRFDLESTASFLLKSNRWIESANTRMRVRLPSTINELSRIRGSFATYR